MLDQHRVIIMLDKLFQLANLHLLVQAARLGPHGPGRKGPGPWTAAQWKRESEKEREKEREREERERDGRHPEVGLPRTHAAKVSKEESRGAQQSSGRNEDGISDRHLVLSIERQETA